MENVFQDLCGLIALFGLFVVAVLGIGAVFLIKIARLPADHPLRRLQGTLCTRLAAMLGVGIVGAPLQILPGVNAAYDCGGIVVAIYLAITFLRELKALTAQGSAPPAMSGRVQFHQRTVGPRPPQARLDGRQLTSERPHRDRPRLGR